MGHSIGISDLTSSKSTARVMPSIEEGAKELGCLGQVVGGKLGFGSLRREQQSAITSHKIFSPFPSNSSEQLDELEHPKKGTETKIRCNLAVVHCSA
jgi:hypothetical protein